MSSLKIELNTPGVATFEALSLGSMFISEGLVYMKITTEAANTINPTHDNVVCLDSGISYIVDTKELITTTDFKLIEVPSV